MADSRGCQPPQVPELSTLRHGSDVPAAAVRSLTASCTHTASDVFMMLDTARQAIRQAATRQERRTLSSARAAERAAHPAPLQNALTWSGLQGSAVEFIRPGGTR